MGKSRKLIPRQANKVLPVNVVKVELEEDAQGLSELKDPDTSSWRTRRRSSKTSTDDNILKKDEDLLPGPGSAMSQLPWDVVLDLSHVTWLDDTGCSLVTWVARGHRLGGLVLPPHLEVTSSGWRSLMMLKFICRMCWRNGAAFRRSNVSYTQLFQMLLDWLWINTYIEIRIVNFVLL